MTNKKIIVISILCILAMPAFAAVVLNKDLGVNQKTSVLATPIPPTEPSPIILNLPGCYKLTENTVDKQIIIDSDDVALLLNGFSLNNNTLDDDAIIVNSGLSDIIIQGGEVSGNNFTDRAGVKVNDNCTNVLITSLKIRNEYYGVWCTSGVSSSNVLIKENMILNCDFGITASNTTGLRIKQNSIASAAYSPAAGASAIYLENALGTSIDYNHIINVAEGIQTTSCTATSITNCVLGYLTGLPTIIEGIHLTNGTSNIIENCIVNSIKGVVNGDAYGIVLENESESYVKNCLVNNLFPGVGITLHTVGIQIRRSVGSTDFCVVQNNVVGNIVGNAVAPTSYGYELLDTTATPTLDNFVSNKAINCNNPVVPYSPNIINQANGPQATDYLWNWYMP